MEGVGISNVSSNSGGLEFLGTIPGSLPEVMRRKIKSCMSYQTYQLLYSK